MAITGMSRDELVHRALRELANRWLPKYEPDDGPLTRAQYEAIRRASSSTSGDAFSLRLF